MTLSEVISVDGDPGNFQVKIQKKPRYVDETKCIACGECTKKCPKKISDTYNAGLIKRKAIYVEYEQAVPLKYAIDPTQCIKFTKDKCGNCEKICPTGAIDYSQQDEIVDINVGSVILSSGFSAFDPSKLDNYQYKNFKNVITSLEFERILAASGPTKGHVLTLAKEPKEPKKIAWLQCVGSRDLNKADNEYCSGVCCMYAIKEAVIAKEHVGKDFEPTIFFMDMRTHGKDFEKYYERAKTEGVRFVRSRVHTITEIDEDGMLELVYVTEAGERKSENFDMVVLSVGMEASSSSKDIAKNLGIELNKNNFIDTSDLLPVATSREGVYVAGVMQGPKDIPQSIVDASAAACRASMDLHSVRGTLVKEEKFPDEININNQEPRIGVFVCNCGTNIGGIADVNEIVEYSKSLPNVEFVTDNLFTCSQDTQDNMVAAIKDNNLNRIVVAACTPRTHEPLFQETLRNASLNPYLFEMANIRNQCTWVHSDDKEKATEKAKDLVNMAVAKAALLESIPACSVSVNNSALVVGGGVAGMTAAVSLADQGFFTTIVEKSSLLGGAANELKKTAKGQNVQQFISDIIKKVNAHSKIDVLLNTEVVDASGFVGNFETTVKEGESFKTISHGVGIIATGGNATATDEYLYGKDPRVTRWHEFDNAFEKSDPKSVVFIQCVGSRDEKRPYCSKICCTSSIMRAISVKEKSPDTDVFVLYRDIRTFGEKESLYKEARAAGVIFIRYSVENKPVVTKGDDCLEIKVFDPILQNEVLIEADLLNLATAIEPSENKKLATAYKLSLNEEDFFMEAHAKLRPVDFATDGVFVCGIAHYPKPLDESIAQAMAAASRAATVLSKSSITVSPLVSVVDKEKCIGCGLCAELCAFSGIILEEVEGKGLKAKNIEASCKGCGICAASCPQKAIDMLHFKEQQIFASIRAAA
jgi:heterodisulfide reductase subunit A2